MGSDAEPPVSDFFQKFPLRLKTPAPLPNAEGMDETTQMPLGGYARIKQFKRAARGIARIGEKRLAGSFPLLIQGLEILAIHINLAADIQGFGKGFPFVSF